MEKFSKEKIDTLTALVLEMDIFDLKLALLCILQGADIDYAIDSAFSHKIRELERKMRNKN